MGLLEKGLVWISLFIALAPMLGFLGTVVGMIQAFDRIEAAGDLSPSVVAGVSKLPFDNGIWIGCSHDSSNLLQLHRFQN